MAKIFTYYFRLEKNQLQWSEDQKTWQKVMPNSPSTKVDSDDEIDWIADDTIAKMKIKFKNGNIIPNNALSGNDSKRPKGRVKKGVERGLKDTYTIKVKPADGGPVGEYDPDIETPPKG